MLAKSGTEVPVVLQFPYIFILVTFMSLNVTRIIAH